MIKLIPILSLSLLFTQSLKAQLNAPKIILNHAYVFVDSTTYQEILKSKLLTSNFAFSHEKKLKGYTGIYILGRNNYIEIFHPKSMHFEENPIPVGTSEIYNSSLKVNHLENLQNSNKGLFDYSSDEEFDYLQLFLQDSTSLFTTWEMNKNHYENWSKKTFNDSVTFLPVDYNSPAESDSTENYLFSDLAGIGISVNPQDSTNAIQYLKLLGYTQIETNKNKLKFSNSIDFIELDFIKDLKIATITTFYLKLKGENKSERIRIGNTELFIEGDTAKWVINKE